MEKSIKDVKELAGIDDGKTIREIKEMMK